MRNASQITLSKAWWKKEAPEGLGKSAAAFEKALDEVAKAEAGLGGTRAEAAQRALEKALEGLEAAARQVAAEAKGLEKKERDKKKKGDLSNTIAVMGRPLQKEIAAARERAAAAGGDDAAAGDFADRDAHVAFLRKWVPKIKRGTVSFALGLPSNKPEEMRFNFHMSKDGRGLANVLKKEAGAKKFTFGKAGTDALATEMGEEGEGARTLVLALEGRRIPGLAKRVKLMLKKLGISQFGRVRVLEDGVEADSADEDTPDDLALEEVDLEETDPDAAEEEAGAPGGGRPGMSPVEAEIAELAAREGGAEGADTGEAPAAEPSARAPGAGRPEPSEPQAPRIDPAELEARYRDAFPRVKRMMPGMDPDDLAATKTALAGFGKALKSRDLPAALHILEALEARADGNGVPLRALGRAAAAPPQPRTATAGAERLESMRRELAEVRAKVGQIRRRVAERQPA